jgi:hypothetical protein
MKLRTAPFSIEVEPLAAGLLDLFTDEERTVLRFGMLPAEKMRMIERIIREKFLQTATCKDGDLFTAHTEDRQIVDFSMKKLVAEAMHAISCELYRIGDLVV